MTWLEEKARVQMSEVQRKEVLVFCGELLADSEDSERLAAFLQGFFITDSLGISPRSKQDKAAFWFINCVRVWSEMFLFSVGDSLDEESFLRAVRDIRDACQGEGV